MLPASSWNAMDINAGTQASLKRILGKLQFALDVFQAHKELEEGVREFQKAVVARRISIVSDYLDRLIRGDSTYVLIMELFVDQFERQESFLREWENIPGINDPIAGIYVPWASNNPLWQFGGCPDTEPTDLRGK